MTRCDDADVFFFLFFPFVETFSLSVQSAHVWLSDVS